MPSDLSLYLMIFMFGILGIAFKRSFFSKFLAYQILMCGLIGMANELDRWGMTIVMMVVMIVTSVLLLFSFYEKQVDNKKEGIE